MYGDQTWIAYFKCGLMKVLYNSMKHSSSMFLSYCRLTIPRILVAFFAAFSTLHKNTRTVCNYYSQIKETISLSFPPFLSKYRSD